MIGKPEWFKRRKYGGWGLMPATWQGWVYVVVSAAAIFGVQAIPGLNDDAKIAFMLAVAAILAADVAHMFLKMPKDERERIHEAIAERNALWALVAVLCVGVAEQAAASAAKGDFRVDPVIVVAIIAAVIVKAATNVYLDRKD